MHSYVAIDMVKGEVLDADMVAIVDLYDLTEDEQEIVAEGNNTERIWDIAVAHGFYANGLAEIVRKTRNYWSQKLTRNGDDK